MPDMDQGSRDAAVRHRSFDAMAGILGWLLTLARDEFNDFNLKGCNALEIGTGKFFVCALGLYVCGCSNVISIDKYKQLLPSAMKLAMSKPVLARRFLSKHVTHDDFMKRLLELSQTDYDMEKLEKLGIKYRAPYDLADCAEFQNAFEFVFSYTVFEHVPPSEINTLLKASIDALKPGGFCMHFVDLEDHYDNNKKPFEFLSTGVEWSEEKIFSRGNRLRFSQWKRILGEHQNIDWRFPYIAIRHDASLPSLIDNLVEYKDEEDLRTTAFVAIGKRIW